MAYAHSKNERGERHDLVAHLRSVGHLAASFADAFGARNTAYWLGLWHDLGKFDPQWQDYLLACEAGQRHGRVDHKAAGAALAFHHCEPLGLLIQGHHGGLQAASGLQAWLRDIDAKPGPVQAIELGKTAIPDLEPKDPIQIPPELLTDPVRAELFLRFLFAALIDADRLDTERHMNPAKTAARGADVRLQELWERFERDQAQLMARPVGMTAKAARVWEVRQAVYEACLTASKEEPGLFRLAVPTGGGKTRSAMAFALQHALQHRHQRIIVAVPYISITQQTAQVYRDIFGDSDDDRPVVLEHHSGVERVDGEGDGFQPAEVWARLASENWDAPIIVTTTVQLFESLFASSTSATRKLHRLARSVIILDEAQALPPHLLQPILDVVRELAATYGTTVVISTATQPAFEAIPAFATVSARDIVPDTARHYETLRRVNYEWRTEEALSWSDVADLMAGQAQALAVVNTKNDALSLLDALNDPGALHLSTLLCGAHRRAVLAQIRERLARDEPVRLVSTQVIEAGVDVDFPLVVRALGPLDSVIQAAGRCNREGHREWGRVVVFETSEAKVPPGAYRIGRDVTRALVGAGDIDPDNPAHVHKYFERWIGALGEFGVDREGIQDCRKRLDYPEVARRFRMIDDDTEGVVVTNYGTPDEQQRVRNILEDLRYRRGSVRQLMRQLQPYVVSVRRRQAERYRRQGFIGEPILLGVSEWLGDYDLVRGLAARDLDAESLVI